MSLNVSKKGEGVKSKTSQKAAVTFGKREDFVKGSSGIVVVLVHESWEVVFFSVGVAFVFSGYSFFF